MKKSGIILLYIVAFVSLVFGIFSYQGDLDIEAIWYRNTVLAFVFFVFFQFVLAVGKSIQYLRYIKDFKGFKLSKSGIITNLVHQSSSLIVFLGLSIFLMGFVPSLFFVGLGFMGFFLHRMFLIWAKRWGNNYRCFVNDDAVVFSAYYFFRAFWSSIKQIDVRYGDIRIVLNDGKIQSIPNVYFSKEVYERLKLEFQKKAKEQGIYFIQK